MLKQRYLRYLPVVIAVAGIAALVGSRSFADGNANPMGPDGGHGHWGRWMFQEMDANRDGKVTQAEIDAFEAARAAEVDTNHDGKITADELQAFHEKEKAKREAAMLARMDTNGDGTVSVQEYEAAQTWRLARMDRNGDGTIDEQDMHMRGGDGGGMHHRHHPWSEDGSDE
ncbi:MAG TPA: EF-hand domain-containing protein [Candidatus Acidoferrum sp.]|nr:EF-hand domain-containing protein [Candidatus Acidoferrum sp.]